MSKEAVNGVINLVNVYKLDVKSLANGVLRYNDSITGAEKVFVRRETNITLGAYDCFLIGKQTYNNNDYPNARLWFEEAIGKVDEDEAPDETRADIFNYLAYTEARSGRLKQALTYIKFAFALFPESESTDTIQELKVSCHSDKPYV